MDFLDWLLRVPNDQQFTSSIVIGELYAGAFASPNIVKWQERIEDIVLSGMMVLPFDLDCAKEFGRLHAWLAHQGKPIGFADVQIAAAALVYDLTLVTANVKHFERIPGLSLKVFRPGMRQ